MKYRILFLSSAIILIILLSSCATIWDVQNLQQQINTLSASITSISGDLQKVNSDLNNNVKPEVDNLHAKYLYLKNTTDSILQEYNSSNTYDLLQDKIKNLQEELSSTTAQNNKNYLDLQIKYSKMQENLTYYQLQLKEALDSIGEIKSTQDTFSKALSTLDETISGLDNNDKISQLSYRIKSLNDEITGIEKSIDDFSTTNLSSSTIKLSDFIMLTAKVDSIKSKLSTLDTIQAEIKELQQKESVLEANVSKMQINKNSLNIAYTYIIVQKGDTLYKISQAYGVDINTIEKLNNKNSGNIYEDELLKIPIKQNFTFPFKGNIKVEIPYGSFVDHSVSSWVQFDYTGNVVSILPGRIEKISSNNVFGRYVKLYCGNYINIIYGNLQSVDVKEGDWISEKQIIGYSKNFRLSISINGDIKDPLKVLALHRDIGTVTYYTEWDDGKNPTYPSFRITRMGTLAKDWETIAADLTKMPLGTIVYIPYFNNMPNKGIFRVEDSGSAVNGNDIDIFISDIQKALKFKKNLEIYVIKKPSK